MELTKVRVKNLKPADPANPFYDAEMQLPSFYLEPDTGNLYGLAMAKQNGEPCYVHTSCLNKKDGEKVVIVSKLSFLKEEFFVFHHSDDGSGLNKITITEFTDLFNQNFDLPL